MKKIEWIKVTPELPKSGDAVLLLTDSGVIQGYRNEYKNYAEWEFIILMIHGCGCCSHNDDVVTHWMPLPEDPK